MEKKIKIIKKVTYNLKVADKNDPPHWKYTDSIVKLLEEASFGKRFNAGEREPHYRSGSSWFSERGNECHVDVSTYTGQMGVINVRLEVDKEAFPDMRLTSGALLMKVDQDLRDIGAALTAVFRKELKLEEVWTNINETVREKQ